MQKQKCPAGQSLGAFFGVTGVSLIRDGPLAGTTPSGVNGSRVGNAMRGRALGAHTQNGATNSMATGVSHVSASPETRQHAWDLAKKISMCMLSTHEGEVIRARPMAAYIRDDEGAIYFLTDARRHKDDEIKANPNVSLAFADAGDQKYVAMTGLAEVSNDRAKIKELWSTPAKAWWDSPEDPNIRVLKVSPKDAEYWDSPGTVVSYVKMAAAAVTGSRPDIGENRKVTL
jgi:general stress protein 26